MPADERCGSNRTNSLDIDVGAYKNLTAGMDGGVEWDGVSLGVGLGWGVLLMGLRRVSRTLGSTSRWTSRVTTRKGYIRISVSSQDTHLFWRTVMLVALLHVISEPQAKDPGLSRLPRSYLGKEEVYQEIDSIA